jgi:hypothetical protein
MIRKSLVTLLILSAGICLGQSTIIITEGSTWKYLDDGSDQGTYWYFLYYDDTPWNEGVSEFGYGDNDESTVVSFGSDASNKHLTTYFRKSFNIENPNLYNDLTLEAIRDDGIVVYLNGTKVWQDNMPENFDYQTPATSGIGGDDETEWISTVIDNNLVGGVNIIAVEIHQSSSSSSDMSFDFKLIGGVNDAPVAQNMSVNVVENSSVDFNLSAVDEDGDEVSFSVGTAENGSTSIYGTTVTYKPQENFSGSDTFTYTATDGNLQTTASVTITVVDPMPTSELLEKVQKDVLKYFWDNAHPISKLTKERIHVNNLELHKDMVTAGGSGFGFLNVIMGIENGWIEKEEGLTHFETALDFLENADRFHGAWPHWMEGDTGNVWAFSNLDDGGDLVETAFLVQGLICVREYFKNGTEREKQIAEKADVLWKGVEWDWYTKGEDKLYWHWSPNHEWAINLRVSGYNEAMITYILAAASPTYTINANVYHKGWAGVDQYFPEGWIKTDAEKYGLPIFLKHGGANGSVGPMFLSHYSNLVLDPINLKDYYVDNYFDVVKNHTSIIYQHCVENPNNYQGYSENVWGLTASYSFDPTKSEMTGYHVHQPDDDLGVITPTAALSSMPYTPEESIKFLRYLYEGSNNDYLSLAGPIDAFSIHHQWKPERHLAIDQGTIGPMIENYKTQLFWNLFMNAPDIREGLSKLGFTSSQHNLLNTVELVEKKHPFFPNPTTSKIFIDAEFSYVKLYDLKGKELIKSTSKHIDLSQLSNNVYILRLYDDSNNVFQTSKVIKE